MSNSSTENKQGELYKRIDKEAWKTEPEPYIFTVIETRHVKAYLDEAKRDLEEQLSVNSITEEVEEGTIWHRWFDEWFGSP